MIGRGVRPDRRTIVLLALRRMSRCTTLSRSLWERIVLRQLIVLRERCEQERKERLDPRPACAGPPPGGDYGDVTFTGSGTGPGRVCVPPGMRANDATTVQFDVTEFVI